MQEEKYPFFVTRKRSVSFLTHREDNTKSYKQSFITNDEVSRMQQFSNYDEVQFCNQDINIIKSQYTHRYQHDVTIQTQWATLLS